MEQAFPQRTKWWATFVLLVFMTLPGHLGATTTATTSNTISVATTTVGISICGDALVNFGEQCDVPGETGQYSETIAGRQCDVDCTFGPYCGDGILQSLFGEECDNGNNTDNDFCSADCKVENAGFGGGGSSGGGRGNSGGSSQPLGDTVVRVEGFGYPNETVRVLLDAEQVGTINADSDGSFEFSVDASPGPSSLGLWSEDRFGTRSITYSTTFDVTQGAVTTVRGALLPPTIAADSVEINPGDQVVLQGQAAADATVQLYEGDEQIASIEANGSGVWQYTYNTAGLAPGEYLLRARYVRGEGLLVTESSFSSSLSLFVGVEGRATTPSDLNRDGSVNLIDFSILIFWWQTAGGDSNPPADINGNGNVGIEDFSIMLFNWTG
jgi:cysteine-rich repeat protein